jgi:hypothetical protein
LSYNGVQRNYLADFNWRLLFQVNEIVRQ